MVRINSGRWEGVARAREVGGAVNWKPKSSPTGRGLVALNKIKIHATTVWHIEGDCEGKLIRIAGKLGWRIRRKNFFSRCCCPYAKARGGGAGASGGGAGGGRGGVRT